MKEKCKASAQKHNQMIDYDVLSDIAMENIEYIYNRLGIFDYTNRYNYIVSTCPIHNGDNKTAFSFHIEKKVWKCFSSAGECNNKYYNNIIGFIMGVKKIEKNEAIDWLCNILGIKDGELPKIDYEEYQIKKYVRENKANNSNKKTYDKKMLDRLKEDEYFKKRGFLNSTLEEFQCGLAVDGYMKNRIVFPINDINGDIIGFCGRIIFDKCNKCDFFHNGDNCNIYKTDKKWLNSRGYRSDQHLFNLNRASRSIKEKNEVIIVEGIPDVMRLHQVGVYNVVPLLRADISVQQIRILMSLGHISTVYTFTDTDKTGTNFKTISSVYEDENTKSLSRYFNVENVSVYGYKDIGDMPDDEALSFCKKIGWR